jgi:TRAP-type C4-dicarboxylate transport system substrate-binding protein
MSILKNTAALALALAATGAVAQDVTLSLHQMLPEQAAVPQQILLPWIEKIEADSDGRIKVDHYPTMQLGGTPPELYDQAVDGVADIIWTVVGYTPGRFPSTEVFELPFMVEDARAASCAYWKMFEKDMQEEFSDVKMLATWVHGPGAFHTAEPVNSPADLEGMKIRGGSRLVNQVLELTGAEPVGLPIPAVAEALSKGVINGTTIPWEVTGAFKVPEFVRNHTEFEGPALYTLTFVMAMNKDVYDSLPEDLRQVIDDNSGLEFSVFAGGTQADADLPAREAALGMGNNIITISAEKAAEWRELVEPVYASWVADLESKGIDGQALIDEAKGLMEGECKGVTGAL